MKISTSKNELRQALQKLSKATPARSTLPILSCVLFKVEDTTTILRSTDLEISIIIQLAATIEEEGSVAVPLQTLLEITNELPDSRIAISVNGQNRVELITDTGVYDLMGKPAEEFPAIPDVDSSKGIEMESDTLKTIFERTSFAVSHDDLKPALTGVYLKFSSDNLTAVSTDGHRLVRYIVKDFSGENFSAELIVPRKFINLFQAIAPSGENVHLWIGENHLTARIGKDRFYTRIIDELFPDYEGVLPTDNEKTLVVSRDEFLGAVRRVSIFANKSTNQIALRLDSEGSTITTEDPEKASKAKEDITCEYTGEPLTIGYNAAYLKDILVHVNDGAVVAKLNTPISAALFLPEIQAENRELTMLLMPIRLND